MVEPVVAGLVSTAIAKGSVHGARKIRDVWQRSDFPLDVGDVTAEFTRTLEDELQTVAVDGAADELEPFVEDADWQAVAHALDELDPLSRVNEEETVADVADAILWAAEVEPENRTTRLERQVEQAVASAYDDALESFGSAVAGTDLADELGFQSRQALLAHVGDIQEDLQELSRRTAIDRRYEVYDADREGFEGAARAVDVENALEFVTRPDLEGEPSARKTLLAGPGGSGKSRALMELLERFPERDHEFEHVVRVEKEFLNTEVITPLVNEPFEGDVLLVWDDVHRLDPEDEAGTFQSAVGRLDKELEEAGHRLHVLATARTERLDRLPEDGEIPTEGAWRGFRPVVLEEYEELFLGELVDRAMDYFEVESPAPPEDEMGAEAALAGVAAEVHPSPLYVTSVVQIASSRDGVLTTELVSELPDEVEELWEGELENLVEENPEAYEILRAIRLLWEFDIPFNAGLVRGVAREVFDCRQFALAVRRLDRKEWISTTDDVDPTDADARYVIHDLKVAVVELAGAGREERIEGLSKFMLDGLEPHVPDDGAEVRRTAHGNLALSLADSPKPRFREYAESHYEHILEHVRPDDAQTHYNYAVLLQDEGDPEAAADQYENAIAAREEFADAHYNYAVLLAEEGDSEAAADQYENAIAAREGFAEAHSNYGLLLAEEGDPEAAADQYENAIAAREEFAEAHYNYGLLLAEEGDPEAAAEQYEKAIAAREEYAEAHSNYGNLLAEEGDPEAAAEQYEKAIAAREEYAEAHYNYAVLLQEEGDPEAAAEQYRKAIAAREEFAEAHYNYAVLLEEQERYDEAEAQYEAAIEANPNHAKAHYNYANLHYEQDETDAARKHVETSVELWRRRGNVGNALNDLRLLVLICEDLDDVTAAIDNCILALGLANRADEDFEDHLNWFGRRCLDYLEDGVPADVETTYDWALRAVRAKIGPVAFPLLEDLWNRREDTNLDDTTETLMTNAAAVAYAAHLDSGFESDGDDEPAEVLQEVTPTTLPPSPKSLYDLLARDYPDVDLVPDDETDDIEPLHDAEDAAFGRLMTLVT